MRACLSDISLLRNIYCLKIWLLQNFYADQNLTGPDSQVLPNLFQNKNTNRLLLNVSWYAPILKTLELNTVMALSSICQGLRRVCAVKNSSRILFLSRNFSRLSEGTTRERHFLECSRYFAYSGKSSNLTYNIIQINKGRAYSSGPNDEQNISNVPKRSLPQLMQFPELVWPSILKSVKNWILVNFIIRPYFDNEFNLPDFVMGSKQALQIVSTKLSEGDLASLSGLVASETISEIKNVLTKMSVAQRTELRVLKEDVYFTFPYQVGIMFDESNEKVQKRWVEITMVFHVLRGQKELQEKGTVPPVNMGMLPEYRNRISICNYRFIKEFTQGSESDWTINVVNHFKPSDFIEE